MKPEWLDMLQSRDGRDKVAIAIDCDVADPGSLNIVSELVQEGIMVWVKRTVLPFELRRPGQDVINIGINADIYRLTNKGVILCIENQIERNDD